MSVKLILFFIVGSAVFLVVAAKVVAVMNVPVRADVKSVVGFLWVSMMEMPLGSRAPL
jgi:hypothetical protein